MTASSIYKTYPSINETENFRLFLSCRELGSVAHTTESPLPPRATDAAMRRSDHGCRQVVRNRNWRVFLFGPGGGRIRASLDGAGGRSALVSRWPRVHLRGRGGPVCRGWRSWPPRLLVL